MVASLMQRLAGQDHRRQRLGIVLALFACTTLQLLTLLMPGISRPWRTSGYVGFTMLATLWLASMIAVVVAWRRVAGPRSVRRAF